MNKDADYKAFVVEHLQSPAAKDDLPTIYSRAKKECPKGLDAFCADMADVVKPAHRVRSPTRPLATSGSSP